MQKKGVKKSSRSGDGRVARPKRPAIRRVRVCPLEGVSLSDVDYKNRTLLANFTSEYGRILPSRVTFVSPSKKRKLARAIKHARYMSLMRYL